MPQVSIILPVYNGERYFREALDSIEAQTFKDFECIIVNDCSTDSSLTIAEEYARKDNRFKVISNEKNSKLPFSLNAGHAQATSPLLTWTSDDNILLPNFLEAHMAYFADENIDITYGPFIMIDEQGLSLKIDYEDAPKYYPYKEILFENEPYAICYTLPPEYMFYESCIGASFMYRKDVFKKLQGYDLSKFLFEDYDFWVRAYKEGMTFKSIEELVYKYRTHPKSLSCRVFPKDYYNFRYEVRKYIPKHLKDLAFEKRISLHRTVCKHLSRRKQLQILAEAFLIDPKRALYTLINKFR